MTVAFDKLSKVLVLERDHRCENRAVIGGLGRFMDLWRDTALQETGSEAKRQAIRDIYALLASYGDQPPAERLEAINAALAKIADAEKLPDEAPTPEPAPPAPPASAPTKIAEQPRTHPTPPPEAEPFSLQIPVQSLRGISRAYGSRLENLGISTVEDLLYFFPRRYDDFSSLKHINELVYGEEVTIVATIWETHSRRSHNGIPIIQSILSDGTGTVQCTWFNQPYLEKQLRPGREIVVSGKVDEFLGRLTISAPVWEPLQKELIHTGRLVPVYPLTEGVKERWLRRTIMTALTDYADRIEDPLPTSLRLERNLADVKTSIWQMHFPDSKQMLERARRRLCFEEFLLIQLGVLRQRQSWRAQPGQPLTVDRDLLAAMLGSLSFTLTNAQQRVLEEILVDVEKEYPMSRLMQGDVGSGKTVITVLAMLIAIANGAQAAMMAPTEILAEQHFRTITKMLQAMQETAAANNSVALQELVQRTQVRLLTGSVPQAEKDEIYAGLEAGTVNLAVGTHALIQESVHFANLALAIVDEQHRFGVEQRAALRQKSHNPHMLVMSATPIPRTLALTIYGDLDVSVIDEMPPNRQAVVTRWLYPRERERAYAFVKSQLEQGRQAFVICPLVEETGKSEAKAATTEYERLQRDVFPSFKLGLLHGRMKGSEKEEIMSAFERGEFDVLVSTSVVEVGIDVPNATVMMVEGADRFGLAQLHQFRGRVGRGQYQSYCILLSDSPSAEGEQRLRVIETTYDGFALAEEDLKMRGPGEFFGTRQSGLPDLRVAQLSDLAVLQEAREAAMELFEDDPLLQAPEHRLLAAQVKRFWEPSGDLS